MVTLIGDEERQRWRKLGPVSTLFLALPLSSPPLSPLANSSLLLFVPGEGGEGEKNIHRILNSNEARLFAVSTNARWITRVPEAKHGETRSPLLFPLLRFLTFPLRSNDPASDQNGRA